MKSGRTVLAGWGLCVALVAVLGAVVFGLDALPAGLLGGAGVAMALVGLLAGRIGAPERRQRADAEPEVLPELSFATVCAAIGFALTLVGLAAIGPAVFWPGVGFFVLGLAGVAREKRAARALLAGLGRGGEGA